ncbi:MAG TPA: hypothetical protein VGE94_20050, partial [Chloroflexota bacterium]
GKTGAFIDEFVSTDATKNGGLKGPAGLVFGPDGDLFVAGSVSANVLRYNGRTGAFMRQFVPAGSALVSPWGLDFGPEPAGDLFVADTNKDEVYRFFRTTGNPRGATPFVPKRPNDPNNLYFPNDLKVDAAGFVYVANTDNRITKYDPNGVLVGSGPLVPNDPARNGNIAFPAFLALQGPALCYDTDGDGNPDSDGDGLCDNWEQYGIDWDRDGVADLELYDVNKDGTLQASERADPRHKDVFVEVDWMQDRQPDANALADVVAAFAAAPVSNPDGSSGIRLHILLDEQATPFNDQFAFPPCTSPEPGASPDFETVKRASFGTATERANPKVAQLLNARRLAFHYTLWISRQLGKDLTSGCAERPGNDFIVSLGGWPGAGNRDQQAGTFMHELGHNLGLQHGGGDSTNCKPNYISIMNYTQQFDGLPVAGRKLDYSGQKLGPLNEGALNEPAGLGGPSGRQVAYGPAPGHVGPANGPIDWNFDGDTLDSSTTVDVNRLYDPTRPTQGVFGCNGTGAQYDGFDDWANLQYNFRTTADYADGVHLSVRDEEEISYDQALALDQTPPVTVATTSPAAAVSGWYRDNVSVSLAATDNFSGVSRTEYNLDGAGWLTYVAAISIATEGSHTLQFRSIDGANNLEATRSVVVRVDKTVPELSQRFDPGSRELVVTGRDSGSGTAAGAVQPLSVAPTLWSVRYGDDPSDVAELPAELRTYRVEDEAGNSVVLVEKVVKVSTAGGGVYKARVVSLQYNGGPVQTQPLNVAAAIWTQGAGGSLKSLAETVLLTAAPKRLVVSAWEALLNQTVIQDNLTRTTRPGQVPLRLTTTAGKLTVAY